MRRNMLFAINYLGSWVNLSEPSSHQNTFLMINKPTITVNYVLKFKVKFIEQIMQENRKYCPHLAFACQYTIHFPILFWPWEGYTTVCSGESCLCLCAVHPFSYSIGMLETGITQYLSSLSELFILPWFYESSLSEVWTPQHSFFVFSTATRAKIINLFGQDLIFWWLKSIFDAYCSLDISTLKK